jgi:hypothetical protein
MLGISKRSRHIQTNTKLWHTSDLKFYSGWNGLENITFRIRMAISTSG